VNDKDYIVIWLVGFIFLVILVGTTLYIFGNTIITTTVELSEPVSKVMSEEK